MDSNPNLQINRSARSTRYYRNAVERHWDPGTVDLEADREALLAADERVLDGFRVPLAKFGAGEQSVTEDLAPLAVVLDEIEDELFVTTQLYEEAKHTDFFDRYWGEVINAVEAERDLPLSTPTDSRWFDDDYVELFERNERAMDRLLTDDTPDNRARAYCHYHLTIEGILAQTGYYALHRTFSGEENGMPELPGLVEGLTLIRQDEGRHVGFGMAQLKELVSEEGVDPSLLSETVGDLVQLVQGTLVVEEPDVEPTVPPEELTEYAVGKHTERMEQITDATKHIPDVEQLTSVESE